MPGAPTYLGRPTMGSFPVCPPFNSAFLATAPIGAYIVPPYTHPAHDNSYDENTAYSSAGSSHAATNSPTPTTAASPKPPPKTFEITIPRTRRPIKVMFVERVSHITA